MERIPPSPFKRWNFPSTEADTLEDYTNRSLSLYFNGEFKSPKEFEEHLGWARENLFPEHNIPDPGEEWIPNLLRQIGYKNTPQGIVPLDDLDLNLQSQRRDILDTIHWPYG